MSVRLVNSVPGLLNEPMKPGGVFHLGLRSEDESIQLGTLKALAGFSSMAHRGVLPLDDTELTRIGVGTVLATSERRQPASGIITSSIVGPTLELLKTDNSDFNNCIYELTIPTDGAKSCLAYFKFRKSPWTLFTPDWTDLTQMTGLYFGLENGPLNTAAYAFLRNGGGNGSLVVGGPLPSFSAARPGQQELSTFGWAAFPDDTPIEVWIYYNMAGYSPPFLPSYTPVVEIWTRRPDTESIPTTRLIQPLGAFGNFPASGNLNFRRGPKNELRLFFGNAGRSGDVLKLDDWALFPDFRVAVNEGIAFRDVDLKKLPDAPVRYDARLGTLPSETNPGRWFPLSFFDSMKPLEEVRYRSGQKKTPTHLTLSKKFPQSSGFQKSEPRIEVSAPVSSQDGAMVEAFMSGSPERIAGDLFSGVLSIDDGSRLFQVSMVESPTRRTLGVLKSSPGFDLDTDYHLPIEDIDYRTMKLVRLVVDRRRGRVALDVDEKLIVDRPISDPFPASPTGAGRVSFGFLNSADTLGKLNVTFLNYLPRLLAYEVTDGLPTAAPVAFTAQSFGDGSGSSSVADGRLLINKKSFNTLGSLRLFHRNHEVCDDGGILIDFKVKVQDFTNSLGAQFAPLSAVGAGVTIFNGVKRCRLGFFNCGAYGKRIGVIPSGGQEEILNQTATGKMFSAPANWDVEDRYRIVVRAYDAIEVWATSVVNKPIISIPWRNDTEGFDLPLDSTSPSISFGHYDENTSSMTKWGYVRWGSSNGLEVGITPQFSSYPSYLFGGRSFLMASVEEGSCLPTPPVPPFVCLGDYTPGQGVNPFVGNVTILSQLDVDALAGFDSITGNLSIQNTSGLTDVGPLNDILEVSGNFLLDTGTDPSVVPMTGLSYCGSVTLEPFSGVTTMAGFLSNLRRVNGTVWFRYGPDLTELGAGFMQHLYYVNWLRFQFEEADISLDGMFPCLAEVETLSIDRPGFPIFGGTVTYDLTNAFPSLITALYLDLASVNSGIAIPSYSNAFAALTSFEYADIYSTLGTTGFGTAFAALETVTDTIYIDSYGGSDPIPSLPSLTTVTNTFGFRVARVVDYTASMPTFDALTSVGYISIGTNNLGGAPGGTWDGMFPNVTTLTQGFQCYADGIVSMQDCLPLVTTTGNAGIVLNPAVPSLADITGSFAALVSTEYFQISVTGLADLDDFSGLTSLLLGGPFTGAIYIANNPNLTSISGLLGVLGSTVDELVVQNNVLLPTTAQVAALHTNYVGEGFVGTFTNTGNGPG